MMTAGDGECMSTRASERVRAAADAEASDELTKDEVFGTLSNARRRHVLAELKGNSDGEATIRGLSRAIAATENGVDPDSVTYAQRKRVYTSLYQSHLPQLARHGIVDFDARSGTVELTDMADTFDVYLEVVEKNELTWAEFYALLSLFSGLFVLAVALEVAFFGQFSGIAIAGIVTLGFATASVIQLYQTRKRQI